MYHMSFRMIELLRIVQASKVSFGRPGNEHNYSSQLQNNLSEHDFIQLVNFMSNGTRQEVVIR